MKFIYPCQLPISFSICTQSKYSNTYLSRLKPIYQLIIFFLSFYMIVTSLISYYTWSSFVISVKLYVKPFKNSKRYFLFITWALLQLNMCIVSYYNINLAYRASLYPIVASVIFLHINMDTDSYTIRSTH